MVLYLVIRQDQVTNPKVFSMPIDVFRNFTSLADDTGLEVDALNGAPGVYSARYAGPQCSFADNNRKLLHELTAVPADRPPEETPR